MEKKVLKKITLRNFVEQSDLMSEKALKSITGGYLNHCDQFGEFDCYCGEFWWGCVTTIRQCQIICGW